MPTDRHLQLVHSVPQLDDPPQPTQTGSTSHPAGGQRPRLVLPRAIFDAEGPFIACNGRFFYNVLLLACKSRSGVTLGTIEDHLVRPDEPNYFPRSCWPLMAESTKPLPEQTLATISEGLRIHPAILTAVVETGYERATEIIDELEHQLDSQETKKNRELVMQTIPRVTEKNFGSITDELLALRISRADLANIARREVLNKINTSLHDPIIANLLRSPSRRGKLEGIPSLYDGHQGEIDLRESSKPDLQIIPTLD